MCLGAYSKWNVWMFATFFYEGFVLFYSTYVARLLVIFFLIDIGFWYCILANTEQFVQHLVDVATCLPIGSTIFYPYINVCMQTQLTPRIFPSGRHYLVLIFNKQMGKNSSHVVFICSLFINKVNFIWNIYYPLIFLCCLCYQTELSNLFYG